MLIWTFHAFRYAGACGFFGGDGADASGVGLRDSCHQRGGRCAGAYEDAVWASGEV